MLKEEFKNYFWNMPAMKYYEPNLNLPKAQEMINNKNNNYLAMTKYDGEWNMAIILEDEVLMRGRNITTTGDYKNRANMLPHITKELLEKFPPGTVLLGELAFCDLNKTSKDVGTIMRCLPAKAIERQKTNPLYFFIFDCLGYKFESIVEMQFEERIEIPFGIIDYTNNSRFIKMTDIYKYDFLSSADEIWKQGGEGLVIIKKDEPYRPGERKAWTSLKLKKKLGEIKVQVIGTLEPTKEFTGDTPLKDWKYWSSEGTPVTKFYYNGWIGALRVTYNENIIDVSSGLTDAMREYFATSEAQEIIKKGEMFVFITGMEITNDSIRHPVFLRVEENKN